MTSRQCGPTPRKSTAGSSRAFGRVRNDRGCWWGMGVFAALKRCATQRRGRRGLSRALSKHQLYAALKRRSFTVMCAARGGPINSKSKATSRATDTTVRPTRGFRASPEMNSRGRRSPLEHRVHLLKPWVPGRRFLDKLLPDHRGRCRSGW